jgi:hypothetical protein
VVTVLVVLFVFSSPIFADERKIHGLVTSITFPAQPDADGHSITRDTTSTNEFNQNAAEKLGFPAGLRVGTEVEIIGNFDDAAQEVRVHRLKIFLQNEELKRVASNEHRTSDEKVPDSWQGEIRVDGERVFIDSKTLLAFEQGGTAQYALQQNGAISELAIDSEPSGAQVKIDGSLVGKTPLVIKTQPIGLGFSVSIQREGYWSDYVQTFTVPGRTILKSTLIPKPTEKPRSLPD